MYINFQLVIDRYLTPLDFLFLQAVKQQKTEKISEFVVMLMDDESYEMLIEMGVVHKIKGTKGMTEIERIRLTPKGNDLLEELQVALVTEEDLIIRDWLIKMYTSMDKMIGNKKRVGTGIAQFRGHTGIEKNALALLLKTFLTDQANMEYNNKLEKVFYSSNSVFSTRFNIDECRLYDYYLKNKTVFDDKFSKIKKDEQK